MKTESVDQLKSHYKLKEDYVPTVWKITFSYILYTVAKQICFLIPMSMLCHWVHEETKINNHPHHWQQLKHKMKHYKCHIFLQKAVITADYNK
jgi:hypothetical protein